MQLVLVVQRAWASDEEAAGLTAEDGQQQGEGEQGVAATKGAQ